MSDLNGFTPVLMGWWAKHKRDLPWMHTKDPYKIWLSEIILQQTTVRQGLPYYNKFVEKYPTIIDLAAAQDEDVFKLWEGLGYYNRAKNMLFTARFVSNELSGVFPNHHEDIIKLKGVGPYTSAAIASFAFELPFPVIDGNVLRLISRYLGITQPIDNTLTVKEIKHNLDLAIQNTMPSEFNQALMDFGSTHCTPKNPDCTSCVFSKKCIAYKNNTVEKIPFKAKKIIKKDLHFCFLHIEINEKFTILVKRDDENIWPNLYQFPKIENLELHPEEIIEKLKTILNNIKYKIIKTQIACELKQTLTHRNVMGKFYKIDITIEDKIKNQISQVVPYTELYKYAFPKIINDYISKFIKPPLI